MVSNLWHSLSSVGGYAVVYIGLGMFLIIHTSYVVERILKIKDDDGVPVT